MLDLHLKPSHIPLLSRFIPSGTPFAPFISDLSVLTQATAATLPMTNGSCDLGIDTTFHNAYHSLEEIYSFGDALVAGFDGVNGIRVESFTVGETFEGREIRGWKAWHESDAPEFKRGKKGKKGKGGKGKKPDEGDSTVELEFVVQSGQHAREVGREVYYSNSSGSARRPLFTGSTTSSSPLHPTPMDMRRNYSNHSRSASFQPSTLTAMSTATSTRVSGARTGKRQARRYVGVSRPIARLQAPSHHRNRPKLKLGLQVETISRLAVFRCLLW